MTKTMNVRMEQVGPAAFEATGDSGGTLIVDGAPDIGGEVADNKLQRAVQLSVEKYCSARATLGDIPVTWEARRETEPG